MWLSTSEASCNLPSRLSSEMCGDDRIGRVKSLGESVKLRMRVQDREMSVDARGEEQLDGSGWKLLRELSRVGRTREVSMEKRWW